MTTRKTLDSRVTIPQSELGADIAETQRLKAEMTRLLSELEAAATGHDTGKPGAWRINPIAWKNEHLQRRES